MPGPVESDIEDIEFPSVEGLDDDFDQNADSDGSVQPEPLGTVVRLDDEPADPAVNDEDEVPVAPVAPMDLDEPAPKRKAGRPSKGATPAKTTAKTPQKATTKTPKSAKSTKTPTSATASKKRKAPEAPVDTPPAKRGRSRAAASNAAAAIKESTSKRAKAPNGTAKPAPKSNGTRGRKKAPPAPAPVEYEEFEVEAILESGIDSDSSEHMFLVKWKGYGDEDNTWEPRKNLTHAADLIRAFEKSTKTPAATGTGKPRGRPKKV